MKPLFINGRFLTRPITGVQRFAREIVAALDKELAPTAANAPAITILAPPNTTVPEGLSVIKFQTTGIHHGHAWEQWDLCRAARGGMLLNFCNCGPALHGDQLTVIHDAMVYRTPENFSLPYRVFHQTLGRVLAKRSRLATVSTFSRFELGAVLGIDPASIALVHNGHEHMLSIAPDEAVLDTLGVRGKPYFLFVGSPTPNKNLMAAVDAFRKLGRSDVAFVLVGAARANVFGDAKGQGEAANIIRPGRLSDEEIVALYKNALALVFPSLYEGFGIPPLEAMVHGCPVLASRIPPVVEVCADAALYFDPAQTDSITEQMAAILADDALRQSLIAQGAARYKAFSWADSAKKVWGEIEQAEPKC